MNQMTNITEKLKLWLGDFYGIAEAIAKTLFIVVAAMLAVKLGKVVIRKFFNRRRLFKTDIDSKKVNTVLTLVTSVYKYSVYIIAIVAILSDVFDLKSFLAAAGIGGIAIGLGVQSLIKDVVAGFFIAIEDQYSVGDLITVEDMSGIVEEMEMRVTKIRDYNGDLYIIQNGEIKKVTNHSRGNKAVIVDLPLSYSSDVDKAIKLAESVCTTVSAQFNTIVEAPQVLGITEMGEESMKIRITAKTLPNEQWEVERRIRLLVIEEFRKNQVRFYDRNTVMFDQQDEIRGGDYA